MERITQTGVFTVGLVMNQRNEPAPAVLALLAELERSTGAQAQIKYDQAEPLFIALKNGGLDLVIGDFSTQSPWQTDVSFAPALRRSGRTDDALELKAAMRNGENRWIMLVERVSRLVYREATAS